MLIGNGPAVGLPAALTLAFITLAASIAEGCGLWARCPFSLSLSLSAAIRTLELITIDAALLYG